MKRSKHSAASREGGLVLPILALVGCGLLAHGMLMLTDYVLWDSHWYIPELAAAEGPKGMLRLFHEIGRPMDYWFLSVFSGRTSLAAVRGLSLAAWIFSSVAAFFVLVRGARLPQPLVWWSCLLAATLPAFDVLGQIALWPNVAALALFWAGWCVLSDLPRRSGARALAQRLCALLLLAVSLNLNSLLVFYYALALFLLASRLLKPQAHPVRYALSLGLRLLDFALLPIAFWAAKVVLTPSSGYYANYNRPTLAPSRILAGMSDMWNGYIVPEAEGMFGSATLAAAAILVAVLVVIPLARSVAGNGRAEESRRDAALMFVAGCGLLFAAGFPYFAVDQALGSSGWLSRNCILTPLPLGLIIVGALFWLNAALCPHRPRLWLGPVVALAVAAAASSNAAYLRLQAEGAKEQSIARKLSALIKEKQACVIQLRDYFFIPETMPYYPPLIWTFIASMGKEAPAAFVVETARTMPQDRQVTDASGKTTVVMPSLPVDNAALAALVEQTTMPYMLQAIPREGPQAMLVVQPGKQGTDGIAIGARYLWLKWAHPSELRDFVDGLTSATVLDLPPVQPGQPAGS